MNFELLPHLSRQKLIEKIATSKAQTSALKTALCRDGRSSRCDKPGPALPGKMDATFPARLAQTRVSKRRRHRAKRLA
jgi:hypothetical protein